VKVGLIKDIKLKEETPLVDVKFTHSLCIGQTGSGKTTSFIYPNIKHRMELGHGILFFDIKGSEHLAIKKLASETNRLDDVVEIGKPWGSSINIIESLNGRTFLTLLEDLVGKPSEGGSNTYFYNEAISLGSSIYHILKLKANLLKEIDEVTSAHQFEKNKAFSLVDIYNLVYSIDTLYDFIQTMKEFEKVLHGFIIKNAKYYNSDKSETYKNIVLNYTNLKVALKYFIKYDVKKDDRDDSSKFESSLLYVISTLSSGFSFMATASAKYISEKENPLDIVQSLQNGKIIIINVRVIPDVILELMLEQIFEQMIDLNLQSEEDKKPISVFIDEAQRLVNKDIPLDVLRSSKVDVLMAVQSEIQLISKFGSREDWQQISVNIAQKFAFKSTYFGGDHLLSFYVETALLETFEYAKEHDANKFRAIPLFLNKEDFERVEHTYQHDILKLRDIQKNEILFYDVTHFENEREIILINIKTKKKKYKKIFTEFQDELILAEIKRYIKQPIEELIPRADMPDEKLELIYNNFDIYNQTRLDDTFVARFDDRDDAYTCAFEIGEQMHYNNGGSSILDIFDFIERECEENIFKEDDDDILIQINDESIVDELQESLEKNGIIITKKDDFYNVYFMLTISKYTIHELRLKVGA